MLSSPVELATGARGVGQSVFYDCIDSSPMTEKKDDMKPEVGERSDETDEELSDIDQDCTIFSGVTYLGASRINAPKSEREILQKVSEMNTGGSTTSTSNRMPPSVNGGNESPLGLKVSVSIPNCSDGLVV